jgi:hypothetical protein
MSCSEGSTHKSSSASEANPGADINDVGVACTHPGAGQPIATTGLCDCFTSRKVQGEWNTLRTCREGNACPTKNQAQRIVLAQDGTTIIVHLDDTTAVEGKLCGNFLVWEGGPTDGASARCGVAKFDDDAHFTSDSCYVAGGECRASFDQGCPGEKGRCTGTGTRPPESAPPIQRVLCN